jgi:hypothetical protein
MSIEPGRMPTAGAGAKQDEQRGHDRAGTVGEAVDRERRQDGHAERHRRSQPVVEGQIEQRESMEKLCDGPGVGAGEKRDQAQNREEPSLPRARPPERKERQRQRDAPRLGARDQELAERSPRERQKIGQQCRARETGGDAERPPREKVGSNVVLDRLTASLEKGQKGDRAQE